MIYNFLIQTLGLKFYEIYEEKQKLSSQK